MRKAVFVDRDGVINEMVYDSEFGTVDSPSNPELFKLLPGVGEAIKMLNEMGLLTLVVSNQPGIAKGKMTQKLLDEMDQKMHSELASFGAHLDGVYYCLHHPEAVVDEFRKKCDCRKPKPGLLLKGKVEFDLDLRESYMVGDGLTDIQAGQAIGCRTVLLGRMKCDLCKIMDDLGVRPDFIVPNLQEAVELIKRMEVRHGNLH